MVECMSYVGKVRWRNPADLSRFVARSDVPTDGASAEADAELLACLSVVVEHHVPGIGIDP